MHWFKSFSREINPLKLFLIYKSTIYVFKLLYHQGRKKGRKHKITRVFSFNSLHLLSGKVSTNLCNSKADRNTKVKGVWRSPEPVLKNIYFLGLGHRVISDLRICIYISSYIHSVQNSVIVGSNPTQVNFLQQLWRRRQWWIAYIYIYIYI